MNCLYPQRKPATAYHYGCRCQRCREANTAYHRTRREASRAEQTAFRQVIEERRVTVALRSEGGAQKREEAALLGARRVVARLMRMEFADAAQIGIALDYLEDLLVANRRQKRAMTTTDNRTPVH